MKAVHVFLLSFCSFIIFHPIIGPEKEAREDTPTEPNRRWWQFKGFFMRNMLQCNARCKRAHGVYWSSEDDIQPAAVPKIYLIKCQCTTPKALTNLIAEKLGPSVARNFRLYSALGYAKAARKMISKMLEKKEEQFPLFMTNEQFQKFIRLKEKAETLAAQEDDSRHSFDKRQSVYQNSGQPSASSRVTTQHNPDISPETFNQPETKDVFISTLADEIQHAKTLLQDHY